MSDTAVNSLASATSPYLKSAAHQPVAWYPWGAGAFEAARRDDKPILLDIGAVWCHWCHVMDGESYEDPALAEFLNQNFICVKVDRDERPDVDARYQRAIQALSGQGGWPLTGFLTPSGEVFFGGTYFPPDGKYGRPGFRSVLEQMLEVFHRQRDRVHAQAAAVKGLLAEALDESARGEASEAVLDQAVDQMAGHFDPQHGGFGTRPKFPHPAAITLLLHRWADRRENGVREMIERTLRGMARGGIHDRLGGGFHRYSVDERWIVPHFEKMAYDNAELLKAYLDAHAAFGGSEYADVARGVVRWIREVLADPDGGYGASQDADVGLHDDGDYFTWTWDEARAVLDDDELTVAAAYYDINTAGEMHHNPAKNVLFVALDVPALARQSDRAESDVRGLLASAEGKLRAARAERPAPFIDRTRYTNWNAMLASGLLRAGAILDDPWAHSHALLTLERLRAEQAEPDAVAHTPGGATGLLDDQVQAAQAALDAWEATGERRWLEWSVALMERVWRDFRDADGKGLRDTALTGGGEGLLAAQARPVQDSPTPSPNGVAAITCARLAEHGAPGPWAGRRDEMVAAFSGKAGELGLYGATFLLAVDWTLHPSAHLVVVGAPGDGVSAAMHHAALAAFLPRRVVQRLSSASGQTPGLPAAMRGMLATAGTGPRAFACVGPACQAPVQDASAWKATLRALAEAPAPPR